MDTVTMTMPPTTSTRRPRRSPSRPATGRRRAAVTPNTPTERPTAAPLPPSSSSTNCGRTGYIIVQPVK